MIILEHITKNFKNNKAVDDISFEVKAGETLVLLGTSGCGKTTTLRMINRLLEPDNGHIYINGRDIKMETVETLRKNIGYVLQNHGLFPHYTVSENIEIVPKLLGWSKAKINERTTELMKKLQLSPATANLYPAQLSGGQQQRVGFARALAGNPSILLMDEPFGALDTVTRTEIRREFNSLDEWKQKTIVLVTHDVQEAFELGDRICLMDKGAICQIGTSADLLFHPNNNFVEKFFDQQRLQLELNAIYFEDIWDHLPDVQGNNNTIINSEKSLWFALQMFADGNKQISIEKTDSNNRKAFDLNLMQSVLFAFKNQD